MTTDCGGVTVGGGGGGAKRAGAGVTNGAHASVGGGARAPAAATESVAARTAHGNGRLLIDDQGRTLYLFTRDAASESRCSDACPNAWPPFIVSSTPAARAAVQGSALGVTRRTDGTLQASYHRHPLYYCAGDAHPGEINCQDAEELGGHWRSVKPSGEPNRASP